jgi:hypothetical protein
MKRLALAIAFAITSCGAPQDDPDLKNALAASALKDPLSVQFQNVTKNPKAICGDLNAKNSYGAYTGFKTFIFERKSRKLWLEDSDDTQDHYQAFLNLMDSCTDNVDVLARMIKRHSARWAD